MATNTCDILECYARSTKIFSYVYNQNVHHVIIECVSIITTLHDFEENHFFSKFILELKVKWTEYFTELPYIYGVACLLDLGV